MASVDLARYRQLAEDFCVEDFAAAEPSTVMVLTDSGALSPSGIAYDKRVAGVVFGADDFRPGMILDRQQSIHNRRPLALLGKVFCKVEASSTPIQVGDLLTTSATP